MSVAIDPNVFIFRNDVKAAVSSLAAGDEVLVRTYLNKAVFIEVTAVAAQPAATTQTGKFNSISLTANGKIATISITAEVNGSTQASVLNVSPDVVIVGNAALLTIGQAIELSVVNGTVSTIKIV